MSKFQGFDNNFFKFFEELKDNNQREWFNENKDRYENQVATPLLDFIEEMQVPLSRISKNFVANPKKLGGSMFRIYRDVRFSKDKRPYKEHGACQFRHAAGKDAHAPGFYVHLEPGNILVGGGIWKPPSDKLKEIRTAIATNKSSWSRVKNNKLLISNFGSINGEGLTRPPRGFDPEHLHVGDLKRTTFFVMKPFTKSQIAKPEFVEIAAATFEAASPLMKFLCDAVGSNY